MLGGVLVTLGLGLILLLDRQGSSLVALRLRLVLLLLKVGSALVILGHAVYLCNSGYCADIRGRGTCSISSPPKTESEQCNDC